jgi:hypothetical protein
MSSLLSDGVRALGLSGATGDARTAAGVIAVLTLLVVLVLREMARVGLEGEPHRRAERIAPAVVLPLTLVFAGVIAPRAWELLT